MAESHVPVRARRGADAAALVVLALVAVVLPLWTTARAHALDVPRSDDWSYLRTLFEWHDTGHLDFNDWVSMTLVGQLLLAKPLVVVFGDSIVAMRLGVAVLGALGLGALYGVARRLGAGAGLALVVVGSVAAGPLWGPLAASFMTDVPGFAIQAVALAAAFVALERSTVRRGPLVAAFAAATYAIAIRQYAAVTLGAVALAALVATTPSRDRGARRFVLVLAAASAVAVLAVLAGWSTIPHRLALEPRVPTGASVRLAASSLAGFLRLAGLLQLPVLVAVGPVRIVRAARDAAPRATAVVATATAAILVGGWALATEVPFVGNYVDRRGTLADDIVFGQRPDLLPGPLFDLVAAIATVAAVVMVLAAVPPLVTALAAAGGRVSVVARAASPVTVLLAVAGVGLLAAYELAILVRLPIFDRYALLGVPLVGLGLIAAGRRLDAASVPSAAPAGGRASARRAAPAALALLALGVLGTTYTAESASYDGGRWHAGEAAVALGLDPADIDAGYEWSGWYRGVAPGVRPSIEERKRLRRRYFEGLCVQVVVEPRNRPRRVLAVVEVPAWTRPVAHLYVVPTGRACASGAVVPAPGP